MLEREEMRWTLALKETGRLEDETRLMPGKDQGLDDATSSTGTSADGATD